MQSEQQDSILQGHAPGCPCNNADERGCFLISAETGKCISCTCDRPADSGPERQHLPECRKPLCDWSDPDSWECLGYGDCDHICICAELLACQQRERDLWERVAAERIADLKACHKPDDCHARADSIEVLLADVEYFRDEK